SVTLTSSGAAAAATVAGSPYVIVASNAQGSGLGNYAMGYVNGKLTVTPRDANVAYIGQTTFTTSGSSSTTAQVTLPARVAAPGSDPWKATHAVVTVMIPPTAYSIQGTGALPKLSTAAGVYGDALTANYTVGMKYNNKGTNTQGQVQLVLTRADGMYYVKSN